MESTQQRIPGPVAGTAFWHNLEAWFQDLLKIPEAARLTGAYVNGRWTVQDGPTDERERARLKQQLFPPLARAGAIAAGVPNGANVLDGWLNLLRLESPHFHATYGFYKENGIDVHDEGGWIQNLPLASAEYCIVRATRAFELETAAAVTGVTGANLIESTVKDAALADAAGSESRGGRPQGMPVDGEKLRSLRELAALTQEVLAEKCEASVDTIQRGEAGGRWPDQRFKDVANILSSFTGKKISAEDLQHRKN